MPDEDFEVPEGAMNIIEIQLAEIERVRVDESGVTKTPMYCLDLLIVPHGEVGPVGRASFLIEREDLAGMVAGLQEGMVES